MRFNITTSERNVALVAEIARLRVLCGDAATEISKLHAINLELAKALRDAGRAEECNMASASERSVE